MIENAGPSRLSSAIKFFRPWVTALTQPNAAAYREILNGTGVSSLTAVLWLVGAGLVGGLSYGITGWLFGNLGLERFSQAVGLPLPDEPLVLLLLFPIVTVIGFIGAAFVGAGLVQLAARLLGGTGSFEKLLYGFAAFLSPLWLAAVVFSALPYFSCLIPALVCYGFILSVIACRAAQQVSVGKALIASLFAALSVLLFCTVTYIMTAILMG